MESAQDAIGGRHSDNAKERIQRDEPRLALALDARVRRDQMITICIDQARYISNSKGLEGEQSAS